MKAKTEPIIAKKTRPTPSGGDREARVGEELAAAASARATRRSQQTNATPSTSGGGEAAEHERVGPAARRRLDDREDERHQRAMDSAGADEVERTGPRVTALGHQDMTGDQRGGDDRHVEPEHRAPGEPLEQQAADERAEADADAGDRRPDPDRLAALLAREDVDDHRQRRRHDHRAADAHHGAQHDRAARRSARTRRARSRRRRAGGRIGARAFDRSGRRACPSSAGRRRRPAGRRRRSTAASSPRRRSASAASAARR